MTVEQSVREIIGKGANDHYFTPEEIATYVAQLSAAPRAASDDTARLDWLEANEASASKDVVERKWYVWCVARPQSSESTGESVREAIDAAMSASRSPDATTEGT